MTALTWQDLLDLDWAIERVLLDAPEIDDVPDGSSEKGCAR